MTAKELAMELNIPVIEVWKYVNGHIHSDPNGLSWSDGMKVFRHFTKEDRTRGHGYKNSHAYNGI